MIYKQSLLKVVDNSGGHMGMCIHIYNKDKGYATLGDKINVTLKSIISTMPNQSISLKKGELYKGIVVNVKKKTLRKNGMQISFNTNGIVLLNNQDKVFANRIFTFVPYEVRSSGYSKLFSLAPLLV